MEGSLRGGRVFGFVLEYCCEGGLRVCGLVIGKVEFGGVV